VELVGYEDVEAGSPTSFSSWVVHKDYREYKVKNEIFGNI